VHSPVGLPQYLPVRNIQNNGMDHLVVVVHRIAGDPFHQPVAVKAKQQMLVVDKIQ